MHGITQSGLIEDSAPQLWND